MSGSDVSCCSMAAMEPAPATRHDENHCCCCCSCCCCCCCCYCCCPYACPLLLPLLMLPLLLLCLLSNFVAASAAAMNAHVPYAFGCWRWEHYSLAKLLQRLMFCTRGRVLLAFACVWLMVINSENTHTFDCWFTPTDHTIRENIRLQLHQWFTVAIASVAISLVAIASYGSLYNVSID